MADRPASSQPPFDPQASRDTEPPRRIAMGQGYGRSFGAGGRAQGFDGSHGEGYGGSSAPGAGFGWADARADEAGRSASPLDPRTGPHAGRGPRGWTRSDERIREGVCERLIEDPLIDARGVEVTVADGVVTLAGDVPGPSDVPHAEMLARQAPGVREVRNELRRRHGVRAVDRARAEDEARANRGGWAPSQGI